MRFLRWLWTYFFPPKPTWADGVRYVSPRHAVLYAEQVTWIRSIGHAADIQSPDFKLTVRVWPGKLPPPHYLSAGCILAPNEIPGDTGGTLCLRNSMRDDDGLVREECKHAITGIGDHPSWLFPEGS